MEGSQTTPPNLHTHSTPNEVKRRGILCCRTWWTSHPSSFSLVASALSLDCLNPKVKTGSCSHTSNSPTCAMWSTTAHEYLNHKLNSLPLPREYIPFVGGCSSPCRAVVPPCTELLKTSARPRRDNNSLFPVASLKHDRKWAWSFSKYPTIK